MKMKRQVFLAVVVTALVGTSFVTVATSYRDTSVFMEVDKVSPGNVAWASDFGTATGLSLEALLDGGKWNEGGRHLGEGSTTIVNATAEGLGDEWPSTNALELTDDNGTSSAIVRVSGLPIPEIGQSLYYRWYVRVHHPDGGGGLTIHPIQEITSYDTNWWMNVFVGSGEAPDGRWYNRFVITEAAGSSPDRFEPPTLFYKQTTYRFEWQMHRVGNSTAQYHIRVYVRDRSGNETLLYDDDDYRDPKTSGATLADNPTFPLDTSSPPLGTLQAGTNGYDTTGFGDFMYQGAFAVCTDTWCGQYKPGEGN